MFEEWFGLEVPNDTKGCLQDIHWSMGAFGYFPTYTLGNLYASQLLLAMSNDLGDIDTIIKSTMTDYNGSKNENDWGLGNLDNPASILRHKGYLKAKKNKWI